MVVVSQKVSVRELRADLRDVLGRVAYGGDRIGVTRNGTLTAVLVSVEDLDKLERHEATAATDVTTSEGMVTLQLSQLRLQAAERIASRSPEPIRAGERRAKRLLRSGEDARVQHREVDERSE